jgi:hypothetical protein
VFILEVHQLSTKQSGVVSGKKRSDNDNFFLVHRAEANLLGTDSPEPGDITQELAKLEERHEALEDLLEKQSGFLGGRFEGRSRSGSNITREKEHHRYAHGQSDLRAGALFLLPQKQRQDLGRVEREYSDLATRIHPVVVQPSRDSHEQQQRQRQRQRQVFKVLGSSTHLGESAGKAIKMDVAVLVPVRCVYFVCTVKVMRAYPASQNVLFSRGGIHLPHSLPLCISSNVCVFFLLLAPNVHACH